MNGAVHPSVLVMSHGCWRLARDRSPRNRASGTANTRLSTTSRSGVVLTNVFEEARVSEAATTRVIGIVASTEIATEHATTRRTGSSRRQDVTAVDDVCGVGVGSVGLFPAAHGGHHLDDDFGRLEALVRFIGPRAIGGLFDVFDGEYTETNWDQGL